MEKILIDIAYHDYGFITLELNRVVINQHWLDAAEVVTNKQEIYLLDIQHSYTNTTINLTKLVPFVVCSFTKETGDFEGITLSNNENGAPFYFQTQAKILLILPKTTNVDLTNIRNLVI